MTGRFCNLNVNKNTCFIKQCEVNFKNDVANTPPTKDAHCVISLIQSSRTEETNQHWKKIRTMVVSVVVWTGKIMERLFLASGQVPYGNRVLDCTSTYISQNSKDAWCG